MIKSYFCCLLSTTTVYKKSLRFGCDILWYGIILSCTHVSADVKLTCIHGFISSLHNGPVYAGHQPRSHHNAAQQPQYAVADPHHHVVEKEEVVETVERLPEEEEEKLSFQVIVQCRFTLNYIHLFYLLSIIYDHYQLISI